RRARRSPHLTVQVKRTYGTDVSSELRGNALTEGLRRELRERQSPIRVSSVSPGYVDTEFSAVFSGSPDARAELTRRLKVLEPDDVAATILWLVDRPAHVEVHDVLVRSTAQKN